MRSLEIRLLAGLLLLLQLADGCLTALGLLRYGNAIEANHLARYWMEHFGAIWVIIAVKTAVALLVLFMAFAEWRWPESNRTVLRGLWLLTGAYLVMLYAWLTAFQVG